MEAVTGIFDSREAAERTLTELSNSSELRRQNIFLFTPDGGREAVGKIPTDEGEQPGMGSAIGGVVGGAVGLATGAILSNLILPGVGPILTLSLSAGSGLGGAIVGAAGGSAAERALSNGLPKDELFVYEYALRCGRSVVLAMAESDQQADHFRNIMAGQGADSIDVAREKWWIGLREAEAANCGDTPENFAAQESIYRAGFEAALRPEWRDRSFAENTDLKVRYPELYGHKAFRRGYERGGEYWRSVHKSEPSSAGSMGG
jgi:hypothetical protein